MASTTVTITISLESAKLLAGVLIEEVFSHAGGVLADCDTGHVCHADITSATTSLINIEYAVSECSIACKETLQTILQIR